MKRRTSKRTTRKRGGQGAPIPNPGPASIPKNITDITTTVNSIRALTNTLETQLNILTPVPRSVPRANRDAIRIGISQIAGKFNSSPNGIVTKANNKIPSGN